MLRGIIVVALALLQHATFLDSYRVTSNSKFQSISQNSAIKKHVPTLVLIAGGTGTGKSTLGMVLAVSNRFHKCVSTDTIREVCRVYDDSPVVQRSSYDGSESARENWLASSHSLRKPIESVLRHAMSRKNSMVLEGVAVYPCKDYTDFWERSDGVALGVLLKISDPNRHYNILRDRGHDQQINNFSRIRAIQDEMIALANDAGWMQVEQTEIKQMADFISKTLEERAVKAIEL